MKRWIFNLAAILSLVLCLATIGVWCRSYWVQDVWHFGFSQQNGSTGGKKTYDLRFFIVGFDRGGVEFYDLLMVLADDGLFSPDRAGYQHLDTSPYPHLASFRPNAHGIEACGVVLARGTMPYRTSAWFSVVVIPAVIPTLLLGVLPAVWIVRFKRRRTARSRRSRGLCPRCGYDLRATPGRCSECGHVDADERERISKPV